MYATCIFLIYYAVIYTVKQFTDFYIINLMKNLENCDRELIPFKIRACKRDLLISIMQKI